MASNVILQRNVSGIKAWALQPGKRENAVFDPDIALWFCHDRQHQLSSNCHRSTAPWSGRVWKKKMNWGRSQDVRKYDITHLRVATFKTSRSTSMNAGREESRWTRTQGGIFNLKSVTDMFLSTKALYLHPWFSTSVKTLLPLLTWTWIIRNSRSQPQKKIYLSPSPGQTCPLCSVENKK